MDTKTKILERLADLEHQQWCRWARVLMEAESLSPGRVERWKAFMVPYEDLPERIKDQDRKEARLIMDVLEGEGIFLI